jgi:2-keto-4-pentenoate hydratase
MLNDEAAEAASAMLWRHWYDGTLLPELPAQMRPATRAEGYAIQSRLERRSRKPLYGWKIAATSKAGQLHINVDGPLAGRLVAERAFESGATLLFGANQMRVVECEFAFKMARDLPPRMEPYDIDEVLAAVATLHPALEVPDSRYTDFTKVGAAQLIADNACAHEFVLGAAAPELWRGLDLAAHVVHGRVSGANGVLDRDGVGSNVLGDPRIALTWLVNELSSLDVTLAAGQVVTTGTCLAPMAITAGDKVHADFGALGTVGLGFGPR